MVEYLEQLVQQDAWEEVLTEAERILRCSDTSPRALAISHCAMAFSRYHLGKYQEAIVAGQLGLELSSETGEWDWYGRTCLDLGASYYCLGQWEQAASALYNYLANLSRYQHALRYEPNVWYNLANVYTQTEKLDAAIDALSKAVRAARDRGANRAEHGFRHALIEVHMRAGNSLQIPALLGKSLHYLRNNPTAHMHSASWLYHLELRSEFALRTGRLTRARLIAVRGLTDSGDSTVHAHSFHVLLARISMEKGDNLVALDHYMAARLCAVESRRSDLEASVSRAISDLVGQYPDLTERVRSVR